MRVRDVMTPEPVAVAPDATIQEAARLMDEHAVGALPVCLHGELLGVLTDRDITVRATSAGHDTHRKVVEFMTEAPRRIGPDDDVRTAAEIMAQLQIHRLPVVDDDGRLVGMLALADLPSQESGERHGRPDS